MNISVFGIEFLTLQKTIRMDSVETTPNGSTSIQRSCEDWMYNGDTAHKQDRIVSEKKTQIDGAGNVGWRSLPPMDTYFKKSLRAIEPASNKRYATNDARFRNACTDSREIYQMFLVGGIISSCLRGESAYQRQDTHRIRVLKSNMSQSLEIQTGCITIWVSCSAKQEVLRYFHNPSHGTSA